ncbi:hypothetical protein [Methanoregula sp.]|jgi:hypothetical protein|uniref:hypothetical protein n=1 Tax=Methanoregula sp. TaxID=2052170 RepID=UPI0035673AE4
MPTDPKPKLKAVIIPVFRVKYQDLEEYIRQVFGFEFDLLFNTGTVNGLCLEYQVRGDGPQITSQQANDLRRGRHNRNLPLMLDVLVADGYIPAGRYIIDTHDKT